MSQRTWRTAGAVAIACSAFMAWYGAETLSRDQSTLYLLVYWGIFLLSLIIAMYAVLLDIRYIRLQYRLGQREIFHSTLGSEEFRRELQQAQQERDKGGDN